MLASWPSVESPEKRATFISTNSILKTVTRSEKTANENPEKRKQAYRSGVAGKLTFRLKIFSEDMSLLETYIHWILDHGRTENREVFRVGWQEVETAIEQALAFMVNEPFLRDADSLRTVTPKDTFVGSLCANMTLRHLV